MSKQKSYTQIVLELLERGYKLSAKCIVRHTNCNNPYNVIYLLRKRFPDKIEFYIDKNRNSGKEFYVYYWTQD